MCRLRLILVGLLIAMNIPNVFAGDLDTPIAEKLSPNISYSNGGQKVDISVRASAQNPELVLEAKKTLLEIREIIVYYSEYQGRNFNPAKPIYLDELLILNNIRSNKVGSDQSLFIAHEGGFDYGKSNIFVGNQAPPPAIQLSLPSGRIDSISIQAESWRRSGATNADMYVALYASESQGNQPQPPSNPPPYNPPPNNPPPYAPPPPSEPTCSISIHDLNQCLTDQITIRGEDDKYNRILDEQNEQFSELKCSILDIDKSIGGGRDDHRGKRGRKDDIRKRRKDGGFKGHKSACNKWNGDYSRDRWAGRDNDLDRMIDRLENKLDRNYQDCRNDQIFKDIGRLDSKISQLDSSIRNENSQNQRIQSELITIRDGLEVIGWNCSVSPRDRPTVTRGGVGQMNPATIVQGIINEGVCNGSSGGKGVCGSKFNFNSGVRCSPIKK